MLTEISLPFSLSRTVVSIPTDVIPLFWCSLFTHLPSDTTHPIAMSLPAYSHYPDYIVTKPSPYVLLVLINRPSHLNTFTNRMWHHLGTLFNQLSHDTSVCAVVLSGCGDNLTAGLDMHEASQGAILNGTEAGVDGARKAIRIRRFIEEFQESVSAVEKCEKRRF